MAEKKDKDAKPSLFNRLFGSSSAHPTSESPRASVSGPSASKLPSLAPKATGGPCSVLGCANQSSSNGNLCLEHFLEHKRQTRNAAEVAAVANKSEESKTFANQADRDYGFAHDIVMPTKVIWREKYKKLMEERAQIWENKLKLTEASVSDPNAGKLLKSKHTETIRKGVPPTLRPKVWYALADARNEQSKFPQHYDQVLEILKELRNQRGADPDAPLSFHLKPIPVIPIAKLGGSSSAQSAASPRAPSAEMGQASSVFRDSVRYIEKDVDRTFSNHAKFQGAHGTESLKRCLIAFSLMHPNIGYTQSMNYLAGLLLLFFSEEEAYWMLHIIVEQIVPPEYYAAGMAAVQTDAQVLKALVKEKLPALFAHLAKLNVDLMLTTMEWFLCLFVNTLPIESALRVWDVLFCEGDVVLFRVGLALLKLHEKDIMGINDTGDMFKFLQKLGDSFFDAELLMDTAFSRDCSVKESNVKSLREKLSKPATAK